MICVLEIVVLHLIQNAQWKQHKYLVGIPRILETKNKKAYLDVVKFNAKKVLTQEDLQCSPQIPQMPKMCGFSISYVRTCSRENMNVFGENCLVFLLIVRTFLKCQRQLLYLIIWNRLEFRFQRSVFIRNTRIVWNNLEFRPKRNKRVNALD